MQKKSAFSVEELRIFLLTAYQKVQAVGKQRYMQIFNNKIKKRPWLLFQLLFSLLLFSLLTPPCISLVYRNLSFESERILQKFEMPLSEHKKAENKIVEALTEERSEKYTDDLLAIRKRKKLRVILQNNSTSYFLYRGQENGFYYELARMLAKRLGVELEVVESSTSRDLIPFLLDGRGDLILADLSAEIARADRLSFTRPYMKSPLVVVQKKNAPALQSIADLSERNILLQPSSVALKRMRQVEKEYPEHIFSIRMALESDETEDLIDMVVAGDNEVAIISQRMAYVELLYRDDIEIGMHFPGDAIKTSFGLRKEDLQLLKFCNRFLRKHHRGKELNFLYKKYFSNRRRAVKHYRVDMKTHSDAEISPWDSLFQSVAKKYELDWRLLAALAFQESRFKRRAKSDFGAQGVMQLMPATAQELGVKDLYNVKESIDGGAKLLKKYIGYFAEGQVDFKDQIRFALASYNVGPGHVKDARKLAARKGWNKNIWFGHVEKAMLLLSKPRYYKNAKYRYCRGSEPVHYVSAIQRRYVSYISFIEPALDPARQISVE